MTDLLPCPFCGGEAGYEDYLWEGDPRPDRAWSVKCKECAARATPSLYHHKHQAAEKWNRRSDGQFFQINRPTSDGWISVEERLPGADVGMVLLSIIDECGKPRVILGQYVRANELEYRQLWGSRLHLQKPRKGSKCKSYFCPEGWYRANGDGGVTWTVNGEVTHWQEKPEPAGNEEGD